jgi:hypothetical protein
VSDRLLGRFTGKPAQRSTCGRGTRTGLHGLPAWPTRAVSGCQPACETPFVIFIVTIVILLQRDDLWNRAIRLFGSGDLHRTTTAMAEAVRRLSRYFVSQLDEIGASRSGQMYHNRPIKSITITTTSTTPRTPLGP